MGSDGAINNSGADRRGGSRDAYFETKKGGFQKMNDKT